MKLPPITRVTGIYAIEDPVLSGRYSEIIISSPTKEIRLRCDHDTDEIILSSGSKKRRKKPVRIIAGHFRVEWLWTMTNQQGYFDGFRIQLAAKRRRHVFEFIAIGSCIDVYEAKEKANNG